MTGPGSLRRIDVKTVAEGLGATRTVLAAVILAAPAPSARLLGADRATARRVTWLTRMLGVRDAALAVGTISATRRGADSPAWLLAGGVSDAVDSAVLVAALRNGRVRGLVPAAIAVGAAGSAAVHLVVASRVR